MKEVFLSLDEIYLLAETALAFNGCNQINAKAVADTVMKAERDGSISHGLFRIPGYVSSLRSKKVNGAAKPKIQNLSKCVIRVDGDRGFAPTSIKLGIKFSLPTLYSA